MDAKFRIWNHKSGSWWKYGVHPLKIGNYCDELASGKDMSIQLFTGLKDKTGQEIYEGDIVDIEGTAFICRWEGFGFIFKNVDDWNRTLRPNEHSGAFMEVFDNEFEQDKRNENGN